MFTQAVHRALPGAPRLNLKRTLQADTRVKRFLPNGQEKNGDIHKCRTCLRHFCSPYHDLYVGLGTRSVTASSHDMLRLDRTTISKGQNREFFCPFVQHLCALSRGHGRKRTGGFMSSSTVEYIRAPSISQRERVAQLRYRHVEKISANVNMEGFHALNRI